LRKRLQGREKINGGQTRILSRVKERRQVGGYPDKNMKSRGGSISLKEGRGQDVDINRRMTKKKLGQRNQSSVTTLGGKSAAVIILGSKTKEKLDPGHSVASHGIVSDLRKSI